MDVGSTFRAFATAWNTDKAADRLGLLADSCRDDAEFVSAQGVTAGITALSDAIGEFRTICPAAVVIFGRPESTFGCARVAWATHWNDGRPPLTGEDFAELAPDGRIRRLVSFDGSPEEGPAAAAGGRGPTGTLSIRSMKLSARNQLDGVITRVDHGAVMSTVVVRLTGGQEVVSAITRDSAEALALAEGDTVKAVIKATEVMIAKD